MGRWSQFDEDAYRLPEGMRRVGYDFDSGRHRFRDRDGVLYEGPQGAKFGVMTKVQILEETSGGYRKQARTKTWRSRAVYIGWVSSVSNRIRHFCRQALHQQQRISHNNSLPPPRGGRLTAYLATRHTP